MPARIQILRDGSQSPLSILSDADYLVLTADEKADLSVLRNRLDQFPAADLIATCVPNIVPEQRRLRDSVPAFVNFVACPVSCSCYSAIAVTTKMLKSQVDLVSKSECLEDLVMSLAETSTVEFLDDTLSTKIPFHLVPSLTSPTGGHYSMIRREIIERVRLSGATQTTLTALKAGLLLLRNFCDESHSYSQSIEGLGSNHTGDYWHAILHRREPDYGNSKYWFRHVGRHPIFPELAQAASRQLDAASASIPKLASWKSRLITGNGWDPFAFVDLCERAAADADLKSWCEQLQYSEMLLLLKATCREAA